MADMRVLLAEVAAILLASPRVEPDVRADARREARVLTAAVLGVSPGALAQRLDQPVDAPDTARVLAAASRRAQGEPLAYAVGSAAFRHLTLAVDARVLIPRPETEVVVEEALRLTADRPGGIAVDIGTGSGAIALALATEGRFDAVIATDISADALAVASANTVTVAPPVPVDFRLGADLAPLDGVRARVIVSNPPYISWQEAEGLPAGVRDWEPATALFAADDGMARYEVLLAGAAAYLEPAGVLVLELDATRAQDTARRALGYGWDAVRVLPDLSGRDRVLVARAPSA